MNSGNLVKAYVKHTDTVNNSLQFQMFRLDSLKSLDNCICGVLYAHSLYTCWPRFLEGICVLASCMARRPSQNHR